MRDIELTLPPAPPAWGTVTVADDGTARLTLDATQAWALHDLLAGQPSPAGLTLPNWEAVTVMLRDALGAMEDAEDVAMAKTAMAESPGERVKLDDLLARHGWTRDDLRADPWADLPAY